MIRKTIILLSLALCVLGNGHHAVSEQHIKIHHTEHHGHHGELKHIGSKEPEHHEEYAWSYPSYEFSYSVHDPHTHDKKGQQESRKGDAVKGEYWLIQPDGVKRTVTYHADKHGGFHANVHYSDHHHHHEEHHGHEHEEEKKEEEKKEENRDEGHGEEEKHEHHYEVQEEHHDDHGEGEQAQGGEESRRHKGGIIRWDFGPAFDYRREYSHNSYDRRDRDGRKYDVGKLIMSRDRSRQPLIKGRYRY